MLSLTEKGQIIQEAIDVYIPFSAELHEIAKICHLPLLKKDLLASGWAEISTKVLKPHAINPESEIGVNLYHNFTNTLVRLGHIRSVN